MKERKRKVDVNKIDKETYDNLSGQISNKVKTIVDEAIDKANKILNIYGMNAKMQIVIEELEVEPDESK